MSSEKPVKVRLFDVEAWLPVPGWEGLYDVSDCGHVLSFPRKGGNNRWYGGGLLKTPPDNNGYPHLNLCRQGVQNPWRVHELMARAFFGPMPDWADCVRHLDDVSDHNWIDNIVWGTISDHASYLRRKGEINA